MLKIHSLFIFMGLFLPLLANASSSGCETYLFLKRGFYMADYKTCQTSINACPLNGTLPDFECANSVAKNNRSCRQLEKLASILNANPTTLTAKSAGRFTIIDQSFPADGQHTFYIISPQGCLINTEIDPRTLSKPLQRKYGSKTFMTINWEAPTKRTDANGSQSFFALLKITDTCLACEVIGWAKIKFNFDKKGDFINTELVSFNTKKPTK